MEYVDATSGVLQPFFDTAKDAIGPYINAVNPLQADPIGTAIDFGAAFMLSDNEDRFILSAQFQRAINNNDIGSILKIIESQSNVLARGKHSWLWNRTKNLAQIFIDRRMNGVLGRLAEIPPIFIAGAKKFGFSFFTSFWYREELITCIYGAASTEQWRKLMTLFGVNRTIENALEDKKEIMFLVDYLPTVQRKMIQLSDRPRSKRAAARRKTKNYRPETDEEFLERIKIEAPRALKKFLCEKYNIRISVC